MTIVTDEQATKFMTLLNVEQPESRYFVSFRTNDYAVFLTQKSQHEYRIWKEDLLYFLSLEEKDTLALREVRQHLKFNGPQPDFKYVAGDPFW
jgi:hypothetical protein